MRKSLLAALTILALGASQAAAQNLLKNPGFEDPTVDTGSALGKWFRFQSGAGASTESTVMPHGGARHINLEVIGANQFAGVFQTLENPSVPGTPLPISPGTILTFSGFHRSVGPSNATSEIKIEWTGAPQNRVDVLALPNAYTPFLHSGVAPVGTTGATITYAISTFGPGQGDSNVYIDDFSATIIPEPTTIGLIGVGLVGLLWFRRR